MSKSLLSDAIRIHCPCADSPADAPPPNEDESSPTAFEGDQEDEQQTRRVFDPFHPRANYSLHPIGYLYFCQECQAIRCPRCVQEEIVSAFCPMCFFEVPLTSIKADGNRHVAFLIALMNLDVYGIAFNVLFVFPDCMPLQMRRLKVPHIP